MTGRSYNAKLVLTLSALIITVAILAMGYFDSPEYNSLSSFDSAAEYSGVELVAQAGKTDINSATIEELIMLEQIGEVRARAIIEYREENGGFVSAEELLSIEKIPEKVYLKIKDKITVGPYTEGGI